MSLASRAIPQEGCIVNLHTTLGRKILKREKRKKETKVLMDSPYAGVELGVA